MEQFTNAEVVQVAKKQKAIIWLILASLAVVVFPPAWIVIAVVNLVFVYQLSKALKLSAPWVWCVGMIIPLVSLILLLRLNSKATAAIRGRGVTVGLMGASKAQIEKLALSP
jgi:hypothetical protein